MTASTSYSPPTVFPLLWLTVILLFTVTTPGIADESHTAPESTFESSAVTAPEESGPWIDPESALYRIVKYTGKYHVMVLHFPIAFLLTAMVAQWYRVIRKKGDTVVTAMLWFGAIGAIGAAALGWMYAYDSVYFGDDESLLFWHRWLGTGTAILASAILIFRRKLGPKPFAIALTLCAAVVAAAAHFGASLVYGPDFLLQF